MYPCPQDVLGDVTTLWELLVGGEVGGVWPGRGLLSADIDPLLSETAPPKGLILLRLPTFIYICAK